MAAVSSYFLGSSLAEQERLKLQARVFEEYARQLLAQLELRRGGRAIDVGCGPVGVLALLSELVGPEGSVIGLDMDEGMVDLARAFVAGEHLSNVRVLHGDAKQTGLPRESFDLAHARLVLVNLANPMPVLSAMVSLVRPGGIVAVQEVDTVSWLCDPPHQAWDRLLAAWLTIRREQGLDLFIGRRLPQLLSAAGLEEVNVQAQAPIYRHQHPYKLHLPLFIERGREDIIDRGLVSPTELTELLQALRAHLSDPNTLVFSQLLVQAWGRRPNEQ